MSGPEEITSHIVTEPAHCGLFIINRVNSQARFSSCYAPVLKTMFNSWPPSKHVFPNTKHLVTMCMYKVVKNIA